MEKTEITRDQICEMQESELLSFLRKFMYESQFTNKDAYATAQYRLCLIQGSRYQKTGNVAHFTKI